MNMQIYVDVVYVNMQKHHFTHAHICWLWISHSCVLLGPQRVVGCWRLGMLRDQLAIIPFAVYPILALIWMVIRKATMYEVQDLPVKLELWLQLMLQALFLYDIFKIPSFLKKAPVFGRKTYLFPRVSHHSKISYCFQAFVRDVSLPAVYRNVRTPRQD